MPHYVQQKPCLLYWRRNSSLAFIHDYRTVCEHYWLFFIYIFIIRCINANSAVQLNHSSHTLHCVIITVEYISYILMPQFILAYCLYNGPTSLCQCAIYGYGATAAVRQSRSPLVTAVLDSTSCWGSIERLAAGSRLTKSIYQTGTKTSEGVSDILRTSITDLNIRRLGNLRPWGHIRPSRA